MKNKNLEKDLELAVFNKVSEIMADKLDVDKNEITMDSLIGRDLQADDLDIVEIIMEIEMAFNIIIPDEQLDIFTNDPVFSSRASEETYSSNEIDDEDPDEDNEDNEDDEEINEEVLAESWEKIQSNPTKVYDIVKFIEHQLK